MDIIVTVKIKNEIRIRKLSPDDPKWWEKGLYYQLKNRNTVHIGKHKLRKGFSEGDRNLYEVIWRLVIWRSSPIDIKQNSKEVTITLDMELENSLWKAMQLCTSI